MKDGLKDIVGKRIAGVVVANSDHDPNQQVFLVFADGTTFEFYGRDFTCCAGLDRAAGLASYLKSGGGQVKKIFPAVVEAVSANQGFDEEPAEDPPLLELLQRDLDAWKAAKAAVAKAKTGSPPSRG
ncbi:MAG: hypothetical protein ABIQ72_02255 [Usitatibacter sp.]